MPEHESEGVVLGGLDGATPLGFLAGVGAQQVVGGKLSWRLLDAWRPVLHGPPTFEAIVDALHDDCRAWEAAPILAFRYLKVEKNGIKPFAGLRAPVAVLRKWLLGRRDAGDDGSLAYAAALMCETANEPLDKPASRDQLAEHGIGAVDDAPLDRATLPTFFDFTSRNAQFLDQVALIRAYLDRDIIASALGRSISDPNAPRTMDWDPGADTPGAIYTGHVRGYLPVAEWLAFRGLVCLPVTGVGPSLETTACSGRRKAGAFVWPLWEVPVAPEVVRSLVSYPGLEDLTPAQRNALGVVSVLQAELVKKADGYSGMFAPASPA